MIAFLVLFTLAVIQIGDAQPTVPQDPVNRCALLLEAARTADGTQISNDSIPILLEAAHYDPEDIRKGVLIFLAQSERGGGPPSLSVSHGLITRDSLLLYLSALYWEGSNRLWTLDPQRGSVTVSSAPVIEANGWTYYPDLWSRAAVKTTGKRRDLAPFWRKAPSSGEIDSLVLKRLSNVEYQYGQWYIGETPTQNKFLRMVKRWLGLK